MGPQLVSSGARESFSQDFVVFPLLYPLPPVMGCTPHCATLFTGLLTGVCAQSQEKVLPLFSRSRSFQCVFRTFP